ncbi:3-hydroxyacyl-CoA dehydrogenase, partial [Diaphorobacter sp. DS2]
MIINQPFSRKITFPNGNDFIENLINKRRIIMEVKECRAIITGGASGLGEGDSEK